MKKALCVLLSMVLLLLTLTAPAEAEAGGLQGFYLYDYRLAQTESGCMLHLWLYKLGGIQYCLDELTVQLLDAEGQEIAPLTTQMIAPLNPVPAGNQDFPVTMVYTLPEGAEAADFRLLNIPGELFDEPSAEPVQLGSGHILMHTKDGPAAICWLEKPVSERLYSGHMMLLYIYGPEDNYLGTQAFSWENADFETPGTQAKEKLAEISRLSEDVLDYYELEFNASSTYYFFADVPLTCLQKDDIPVSANADAYRTKSPLTVLTSSFERLEDGRWRAYALLQSGSCEPVAFGGHHVDLYDANGVQGQYTEVEFGCALRELEPFGFTTAQYILTGLPEDFVPAELAVYGRAIHQEAPCTVKKLPQEYCEVIRENGSMYLRATIPHELCATQRMDGMSGCTGLLWYARNPADNSMLSCGAVQEGWADDGQLAQWTASRPIEITNIPEGVTPELLVFFMDAK